MIVLLWFAVSERANYLNDGLVGLAYDVRQTSPHGYTLEVPLTDSNLYQNDSRTVPQ